MPNLKEFHLFPELPAELRIKVWQYAAYVSQRTMFRAFGAPRLGIAIHIMSIGPYGSTWLITAPPVALLLVNFEAWDEVRRHCPARYPQEPEESLHDRAQQSLPGEVDS